MKNGFANTAIEITTLSDLGLRAKPVMIGGIMQRALHELLTPHDCIVRGNKVRIYAGTVVSLTAYGESSVGGLAGKGQIMHDLRVKCLDGVVRTLPANSSIEILRG